MASNVSRGAAAKSKTKKWLETRGYVVWDMEVVRTIWKPSKEGERPKPAFSVKRDQCASDLGAMGHNTVLFVQVKSGDSAKGGTFPAARREFATFTFPEHTRQLIIGWPPQARVPRIVEVFSDGSYREAQAI